MKHNHYFCEERSGNTVTIGIGANQPVAYKDKDGKFKLIKPLFETEAIEGRTRFYSDKNCLKVYISSNPAEEYNLSYVNDNGFQVDFDVKELQIGKYIEKPDESQNFVTEDPSGVPTLLQIHPFKHIIDEYKIGKGMVKRSLIVEKEILDKVREHHPCKFIVRHIVRTNTDVSIMNYAEERHGDFSTTSKIEFVSKENPDDVIIFDPPDIKDSNDTYLGIEYHFKFLGDNLFEIDYAVESETLLLDGIKYPLIIDPTASVSRPSGSGTTRQTFTINTPQELSWSATLKGAYVSGQGSNNRTAGFGMHDSRGPSSPPVERNDRGLGKLLYVEQNGEGTSTPSGTVYVGARGLPSIHLFIYLEDSSCSGSATVTYVDRPTFSWSSTNTIAEGNVIKASDFQQNTNTALSIIKTQGHCSSLSMDWSGVDLNSGGVIYATDITKLRSNLDMLVDNSACTSDRAHNSSYYTNHDSSYYSTH